MDKQQRRAARDAYKQADRDARWARLGLTSFQLADLLDHLDRELDGCDRTLALTERWAVEHDVDVDRLIDALLDLGGGCDCEVLANVDPSGW